MKILRFTLFALFVALFISCGNQKSDSGSIVNPNVQSKEETTADIIDEKSDEIIDRKLIKEGFIQFQTSDLEKTHSKIVADVASLKGYISKENVNTYDENVEHQLIIRIPADRFDELLKRISSTATLESKSIQISDVTEDYIDINARLNTKKELETKYKELLKNANNVSEILEIEKAIASLQSDIESVEGRLKYLNDQIKYSTLSVTYYQKGATSFSFINKILPALKDGWHGLLAFIVLLFQLWAFIIIGGIIAIFIIRKKRRNRKNANRL